jgi:hypothetical protein
LLVSIRVVGGGHDVAAGKCDRPRSTGDRPLDRPTTTATVCDQYFSDMEWSVPRSDLDSRL